MKKGLVLAGLFFGILQACFGMESTKKPGAEELDIESLVQREEPETEAEAQELGAIESELLETEFEKVAKFRNSLYKIVEERNLAELGDKIKKEDDFQIKDNRLTLRPPTRVDIASVKAAFSKLEKVVLQFTPQYLDQTKKMFEKAQNNNASLKKEFPPKKPLMTNIDNMLATLGTQIDIVSKDLSAKRDPQSVLKVLDTRLTQLHQHVIYVNEKINWEKTEKKFKKAKIERLTELPNRIKKVTSESEKNIEEWAATASAWLRSKKALKLNKDLRLQRLKSIKNKKEAFVNQLHEIGAPLEGKTSDTNLVLKLLEAKLKKAKSMLKTSKDLKSIQQKNPGDFGWIHMLHGKVVF